MRHALNMRPSDYMKEIARFMQQGAADRADRNKKVISFSLFGHGSRYFIGARENLALQPIIYPGWICRFYVAENIPSYHIDALRSGGAEIVIMRPEPGTVGTLWRFLAIDEEDIGVCIIRDADSRFHEREKRAVEAWLSSEKYYHIMRSHTVVGPRNRMPAGSWGAKGSSPVALNMRQEVENYISRQEPQNLGYGVDEGFLTEVVYPRIRHQTLIYSDFPPFPDEIVYPSPKPISEGERYVGTGINPGIISILKVTLVSLKQHEFREVGKYIEEIISPRNIKVQRENLWHSKPYQFIRSRRSLRFFIVPILRWIRPSIPPPPWP